MKTNLTLNTPCQFNKIPSTSNRMILLIMIKSNLIYKISQITSHQPQSYRQLSKNQKTTITLTSTPTHSFQFNFLSSTTPQSKHNKSNKFIPNTYRKRKTNSKTNKDQTLNRTQIFLIPISKSLLRELSNKLNNNSFKLAGATLGCLQTSKTRKK